MLDNSRKIHVLLIGINHYLPNRFYKPLRGCLHDINLVDDYLQTALRVPSTQITRLASPDPKDIALSALNAARADKPPTYENIVKAFDEITNQAQSGEQVYIHYSGHGGRVITSYPEIKGTGQHDEGLVPSDIGASGRYVRDVEMATLLKRMSEKGLVVTLVLDSCHSGGATRGDCAIRGSSEVDTEANLSESLVGNREELVANWRSLTEGNRAVNWLPSSRDYVVMCACRPSEFAFEYAVSGQERHGALTYWMIDTLSNHAVSSLDYRTLHNRISAKVQSLFPQQLPMLMGEETRLVLSTDTANRRYTVPVLACSLSEQRVKLKAGLAQGISRGSRFALYPFNTQDFSEHHKLAVVEIDRLESTTCSAKVVDHKEGGINLSMRLAEVGISAAQLQGASAVMESTPTNLQRQVSLIDNKQIGDKADELPRALFEQQQAALEKIRQALADNGWIKEAQHSAEAHYQVAVGREGDYEICIGLPLENLRPPLPLKEPDAARKVVERLVHLAKYQAVQELDNPASSLAQSLKVDLLTQPGWEPGNPVNPVPFSNPQSIEITSGSFAFLKLVNHYRSDINIAVLDIMPTWAIAQLPILGLSGALYSMAPNEERIIPLQFSLPHASDTQHLYTSARETIKVFATLGPADFSWLELPPLDNPIQPKGSPKRGGDPLSQLLEAMGAAQPTLSRAIALVRDPNQDWATKQIRITITQ